MTKPGSPASTNPPAGASGSPNNVGHRQSARSDLDLAALSDRVYALMLEDLRLELTRREGRVR